MVNDDGKTPGPSIKHSENGISQLPKTYDIVSAHGTQRPESERGSDAMDKYSLLPSSSSDEGNHTPRSSLRDLQYMRTIQGVMKLPLNSPTVAGNTISNTGTTPYRLMKLETSMMMMEFQYFPSV